MNVHLISYLILPICGCFALWVRLSPKMHLIPFRASSGEGSLFSIPRHDLTHCLLTQFQKNNLYFYF